jgi:hypothetical protein
LADNFKIEIKSTRMKEENNSTCDILCPTSPCPSRQRSNRDFDAESSNLLTSDNGDQVEYILHIVKGSVVIKQAQYLDGAQSFLTLILSPDSSSARCRGLDKEEVQSLYQ